MKLFESLKQVSKISDMKDSFAVLLAPGANRPLAQEKPIGGAA